MLVFLPSWLLTLSRALVLVAAGCALALALAFQFGSQRTWWIELLRYVPYLAWLLPALLSLALSMALSRRWRLLALATLGLVLVPVMGLSLGLGKAQAGPQEGFRPVRMMSYNIKSFRAEQQEGLYEALADEITHQAPDLLVMQDAPHLNRPEGPHEALRTALQGYQLHGFGQYMVASRFPLKDCRVGQMPIGLQAHTYLRCTVLVGRTALTLLTAHTLTPREGLNATRSEKLGGLDDWRENFAGRMAQARQLAADVAELPRPLIVAGDLNAPEHSPVVQVLLDEGLRDAFGTAGLGWGYTLGHALKPHMSFLRIDHILVSPEIRVLHAAAGGRLGSEHRPVVADLQVPD